MNKKFSTFLTAGLLIGGSLFSYVDAKDIKGDALAGQVNESTRVLAFDNDLSYTLTSDCDLKNEILVIQTQGATLDGGGKTFKGRIVVNAEGVTIKNLTLTSKSDGYGYWQKNGISVFADKVTITNVDFTAPKSSTTNAYVGNSLVIYPKTGKSVSYEISGNTFSAGLKTSDGYTSAGILVAAGSVTERDGDPISGSKSGAEITDKKFDLIKVANGNTFESCWLDYALTSTEGKYQVAKVTPSGKIGALKDMVPDLVNNAADDHTLIIDAAVADVETHAKKITDKNVAIQCSDANLLLGKGKAPNNGKPSLLSNVAPLQKEVAGAKLYESATGEYAMLIMRSGKKDYAIKAEDIGKGVDKITEAMASQDEFLWRMTSGKNADGTIWYRFESKKLKDGKPVVVLGEGTGAWQPVNNVAYNKFGVAFEKSGADLSGTDKTYFGLYKAGNNLLKANDLNWYEKDGFSYHK